jgi:hypothetical protein
MTDTRLPDRWLTDRRIQRLTDRAYRCFFNALMWSVANRSDGVIEPDDLDLIPGFDSDTIDELVMAGVWVERHHGGWLIADFFDTQTSAAEHEALSAARKSKRESQARWRAKNATRNSHVDATEASRERSPVDATKTVTTQDRSTSYSSPKRLTVVTTDVVTTSPNGGEEVNPSSSKAQSLRKSGTALGDGDEKPKRATRLPQGWMPPAEDIDAMKARFPNVDLSTEHEKFCNYWHAKSGQQATKLDWPATWRNWIIKAAADEAQPRRNGRSIDTAANTRAWMAGRSEG